MRSLRGLSATGAIGVAIVLFALPAIAGAATSDGAPALSVAETDASVRTVLVSRVGLDGPAADDQSFQSPSISSDGRFIAFFSRSTNLTPDDPVGDNIFRKDTLTGETQLVSVDPGGNVVKGAYARMSDNGQQICFVNGVAGSAAGGPMTVHNAATATSRAVPGNAIGVERPFNDADLTGHSCAVSDDGQSVVYNTLESHDPADTNGLPDIYQYSFATGTWTLISRADGVTGAVGNDYSRNPTMTPDGRYVVYWSKASNLAPGDPNGFTDVYRRDVVTGTTELVSAVTGTTTSPGAQQQFDQVISDDGRYVAFASDGALTEDVGLSKQVQIWRRDMVERTTLLVSRVSGPDGKFALANSYDPSISPDGRYVAFDTFAANLDPGSLAGADQINLFVRDIETERTAFVSRASGVFGDPADDFSFGVSLAGNLGRVAFASRAENFSPDDVALGDIYYRDTVGLATELPANVPGLPKLELVKPIRLTLPPPLPPPELISHPASAGALAAGSAPKKNGLRFTVSEWTQGTVLVLERCAKVVRAPRRKPRCTRFRRLKQIDVGLAAEGSNQLSVGRNLRPGLYRVKVQGTDLGSENGTSARRFTIR